MVARVDPITVREKFALARKELSSALIEREDDVDLVLAALVAREHVLLVGPPGCAKSLLLDSVLAWAGGRKFSALLTKFTVPEEVLGPVSLAALKEDRFVRVTAGKLPEANFAFLDEVFKASSAILNTLLKILNERTFDVGDGVARPVPLQLCVAASNEWPSPDTGKELAALFDRFVLRRAVRPIRTQAGRRRLLWTADHTPSLSATVSPAEVEEARAAAAALPWTPDAREAFEVVLRELAREGVHTGDRRQFKTVGVVRAFAYLSGADAVSPEHLEVAAHTLWDSPEEQPQAVARVIGRVANPTGMRVGQLLLEAEEVLAAADVRNLAEAAKAAAKLAEIDKQLAALKATAGWSGPGRTSGTSSRSSSSPPSRPSDRTTDRTTHARRDAPPVASRSPTIYKEVPVTVDRPHPDWPLVVAYGLGVNSTALLVEFVRRGIRPDLFLFADTGGEKPETYAYLPVVQRYLRRVKFPPVVTVRYEPKTATYRTLEGSAWRPGRCRAWPTAGSPARSSTSAPRRTSSSWPDTRRTSTSGKASGWSGRSGSTPRSPGGRTSGWSRRSG